MMQLNDYLRTQKHLPAFDLRILAESYLGLTQEQLYRTDIDLTEAQKKGLDILISRRTAGEPLQYLVGRWEFYGLEFFVGEGVLIPRADTETIIDLMRERLDAAKSYKILDLCSGSGCIAVTLGRLFPQSTVTAVELSDQAFGYLQRNILHNRVHNVQAVQADIFAYEPEGIFDLILSNPPYLTADELLNLQKEVTFEPSLALDGNLNGETDGLSFYRRIVHTYRKYLAPNGLICFEIGYEQAQAVAAIAAEHGFTSDTYKDYAGLDRVMLLHPPTGCC